MAQADTAAPALGMPGLALMRNAARAVAQAARHLGPCRTLVLCGPGNNGGDGWATATLLARQGWPVAVAEYAPPRPGSDAATVRSEWQGPIVPFNPTEAARADLVIDAVFGAGLRPNLSAGLSADGGDDLPTLVAETLAAASRVLAIDIPSGIDGATGQCRGTVRAAALTITFVAAKPGHLLLPGRALCGTLHIADILMPPAALPETITWRNTPALWTIPAPDADSHKYTRGHVTVLGGAQMTGAARLAAAAARRAGAGLVTIAAPHDAPRAAEIYRTTEPGTIVLENAVADLLADPRRKTWVCGPGLSQEAARAALPLLRAARRQIVADADALAAAADHPDLLRGCTVITPHAGEFAKLFGPPGPDKLTATRAAAKRIGCVVVFKGADTVIAAPDGRAAINDNAPPWLATAGAGDVLAGLIAALLAQGMPAWEAACAAVHVHGQAAQRAGPGLIAETLLDHLQQAIIETQTPRNPAIPRYTAATTGAPP